MLIYNHKKEFIGIDIQDLKLLGLQTLAQLYKLVDDYADLFVQKPGYISNFTHVHWIDYIADGNSLEVPKVLIEINGKRFEANVTLSTIFLKDDPEHEAYIVNIRHLHNSSATTPTDSFTTPEFTEAELPPMELEQAEDLPVAEDITEPLEYEFDDKIEITPEPTIVPEPEIEAEIVTEQAPTTQEQKPQNKLDPEFDKYFSSGYVYDPKIASDELGLPLDLIEEFLGDFIVQAHDFKKNLYTAIDEDDIETIKALSHKMKGVAANLRIENLFEVLTTINTNSDISMIKKNLDLFYILLERLSKTSHTPVQESVEKSEVVEATEKFQENSGSDIDLDKPIDLDAPIHIDLNDVAFPHNFPKNINQNLADEIGVNLTTLHELYDDFKNESKELFEAMKADLTAQKTAEFKVKAKQLQEMCDNFKFVQISQTITTLLETSDEQFNADSLTELETLLKETIIGK